MFVLFERKCPAKWTSQDIPLWFQFEANVYIPFKVHISVRDVNLNCIYLQRYMISHSSVREDVAQRKSMNECSEVKQTSTDFPCSGSREQWTLCRKHVNRNTFHVRNTRLTSWLSESGVLTKRNMQNMQRGGARGLELRTAELSTTQIPEMLRRFFFCWIKWKLKYFSNHMSQYFIHNITENINVKTEKCYTYIH